jgi:hypothetical protein
MKHITSLVNEAFKHRQDLLDPKYGPIITDQMKNKVKIAIDQVGIAVKHVADELGSTLDDVGKYIKTIEHDHDREMDAFMAEFKTEQQEKDELIKREEDFKVMEKNLNSKSKELDAMIVKQTQAEETIRQLRDQLNKQPVIAPTDVPIIAPQPKPDPKPKVDVRKMPEEKTDVPTLGSFEWKLDGKKMQFTGLQVNGIPEGAGYCYDEKGTKYEGIWSKGKLNGVMKMTSKSGDTY